MLIILTANSHELHSRIGRWIIIKAQWDKQVRLDSLSPYLSMLQRH